MRMKTCLMLVVTLMAFVSPIYAQLPPNLNVANVPANFCERFTDARLVAGVLAIALLGVALAPILRRGRRTGLSAAHHILWMAGATLLGVALAPSLLVRLLVNTRLLHDGVRVVAQSCTLYL